MWTRQRIKAPDFAIFFDFLIFLIFWILGPKMDPEGPGRASKGSGEAFRFIWTKFQPKWAHLGPIRAPFCFSISPKPILGPNSSKSIIPNEVLGPWGPGWGERAAPGGRRPTFGGVWGGAEPPHCNAGGVGVRQPPHRKRALGAIANSEIRNPDLGSPFGCS